MKLGLIARCDNRGIAYQTWEFFRHMPVDRTLLVMMDDPAWPESPERFTGDVVQIRSNLSPHLDRRGLDEDTARRFLDGLDVVFAVETVYDWRLINWAHDARCKVVIQGNPEFYAHHRNPWPHPDLWVWPTPWMLDHPDLSATGGVVLPVPVPDDAIPLTEPHDGPLRVLHAAGKAATGDRAGTWEFIEALRGLRVPVDVTIVTQEPALPAQVYVPRSCTARVTLDGVDDRWSMYRDQDVLVTPRKFGGLHLPAIEALASGLIVALPDVSPNETWPGPRMRPSKGRIVRTPFGGLQTVECRPDIVRAAITELADPATRQHEHTRAAEWVNENRWSKWRAEYERTWERVT